MNILKVATATALLGITAFAAPANAGLVFDVDQGGSSLTVDTSSCLGWFTMPTPRRPWQHA